jgi:hypothetical protein
MNPEMMAQANWRLENPPPVDVAVSKNIGLFVVGRLAARHGVKVRLQPAAAGGLTAQTWLPDAVIVLRKQVTASGSAPGAVAPQPAQSGPPLEGRPPPPALAAGHPSSRPAAPPRPAARLRAPAQAQPTVQARRHRNYPARATPPVRDPGARLPQARLASGLQLVRG